MAEETFQTLRDYVEEQLKNSGDTVTDRVKAHFVEQEVSKRADLLIKGMIMLRAAEGDQRKIEKPDMQNFDAEGKVTSESYSKARVEEIKKGRERIAKIKTAVNTAIKEANYQKLDELLKNTPKAPDAKPGGGP